MWRRDGGDVSTHSAMNRTLEGVVSELKGRTANMTALWELRSAIGAIEVYRTGVVAIDRGSNLDMPVFSTLEVNRKKAKQSAAGKKAQKKA